MVGHHKAKNWGCPDTVDTNGSSPMPNHNTQVLGRLAYYFCSNYADKYTKLTDHTTSPTTVGRGKKLNIERIPGRKAMVTIAVKLK